MEFRQGRQEEQQPLDFAWIKYVALQMGLSYRDWGLLYYGEFRDMLERRTGRKIVMWDERLTTAAANRVLDEAMIARERRKEVIDKIYPALNGKAVLSIAAGWTVSMLERALHGTTATYLRVMPNTPALVGEGMTAICDDTTFSDEDFNYAKGIFDSVGKTKVLPERLFDGVVAVSGSSPAYVYMMIEAMADAAVREGIPRVYAYEMAAQSVLGSALMVLSSGTHPAALKDAVCSPGGTTIEAVEELEKHGFRAAVMNAMEACARKSREMSKA